MLWVIADIVVIIYSRNDAAQWSCTARFILLSEKTDPLHLSNKFQVGVA